MNVDPVARRILAEFDEMPGLTLTVQQAARLFGLNEESCQIVLDSLVDMAYLRSSHPGVVARGVRVAA